MLKEATILAAVSALGQGIAKKDVTLMVVSINLIVFLTSDFNIRTTDFLLLSIVAAVSYVAVKSVENVLDYFLDYPES
jgi:hypothetical protein